MLHRAPAIVSASVTAQRRVERLAVALGQTLALGELAIRQTEARVAALPPGRPLADAIGLFKEVDDARVGSGFSFNDIAAGRAGVRFAGLAAASPRQLQAVLAAGMAEGDVMPEVADLPEFMTQAEFQRRFGGIGSPAYADMMARIEARLDAMPLARRCAAEPVR